MSDNGEHLTSQDEPAGYDASLIWRVSGCCNLSCVYCFASRKGNRHRKLWDAVNAEATPRDPKGGLLSAIARFRRKALLARARTPAMDVSSLLRTLEATGRVFKIVFTANYAEPFLIPNIVDACVQITDRHYVSFNTNLTPDSVGLFAERINPKRVELIHASIHIKELERRNLMGTYISHFRLLRNRGFKIVAEEVAYPGLVDEADKYRDLLGREGIPLTFGAFGGEYAGKEYPAAYSDRVLEVFRLDRSRLESYFTLGKPCNAGYNAGVVEANGDVHPCLEIDEVIGNVYKRIDFKKAMIKCPCKLCGSPMRLHDEHLFAKAIAEKPPS